MPPLNCLASTDLGVLIAMGSDTKPASDRLFSIDALRGFDMFWIIGGDALFQAWARWVDWSPWTTWPVGAWIVGQLEHVPWEGFHFYDLIFPLFLFVVGVVIPFSLGKLRESGEATLALYWRILRRTALLFLFGLLYNNLLQFDFANLRFAGVLQRIAICYGVAALLVVHTRPRTQAVLVAAILLGYWALLGLVPAPGSPLGDYSKTGNLAGYVDRHWLPGMILPEYYGDGDNEGLLSTIPAVATALLGVLAGHWLRSAQAPGRKVGGLALAGIAALFAGSLWSFAFPIIKNIWTSSFVLVAAGWSLLLLALFYLVIDVWRLRAWAFFFVVIGANAITIYLAPEFLDFAFTARALFGGLARLSGAAQPVVLALGLVVVKWLFLLYLYRKGILLRV
jgi:predicted acyltransferase